MVQSDCTENFSVDLIRKVGQVCARSVTPRLPIRHRRRTLPLQTSNICVIASQIVFQPAQNTSAILLDGCVRTCPWSRALVFGHYSSGSDLSPSGTNIRYGFPGTAGKTPAKVLKCFDCCSFSTSHMTRRSRFTITINKTYNLKADVRPAPAKNCFRERLDGQHRGTLEPSAVWARPRDLPPPE